MFKTAELNGMIFGILKDKTDATNGKVKRTTELHRIQVTTISVHNYFKHNRLIVSHHHNRLFTEGQVLVLMTKMR